MIHHVIRDMPQVGHALGKLPSDQLVGSFGRLSSKGVGGPSPHLPPESLLPSVPETSGSSRAALGSCVPQQAPRLCIAIGARLPDATALSWHAVTKLGYHLVKTDAYQIATVLGCLITACRNDYVITDRDHIMLAI